MSLCGEGMESIMLLFVGVLCPFFMLGVGGWSPLHVVVWEYCALYHGLGGRQLHVIVYVHVFHPL